LEFGFGAWAAFNLFVLAMLALDLGVFHRRAHEVRIREAGLWSMVWVALALAFCGGLYWVAGPEQSLQFLTGYLVEKTLAVDNIFVIVVIFGYFGVPSKYQHRVLFWGVLGALLMRGTFIGLGAYVLDRWHWVMYVFGVLLVLSGLKLALRRDEKEDLERNPILRLSRRFLPLTKEYHGHRFYVREGGRLLATPLLVVLLVVEFSDLVFAIDSIPAIFAITQDPYIVYTSNVFAILGLRSMYFLLAGVMDRFAFLKYALALVLVFIGTKMLLEGVIHISTPISLSVVGMLLGIGVLVSVGASKSNDVVSVPAPPPAQPLSPLDEPAPHVWSSVREPT
jgi:tellurite resistance protein TerC